MGPGGPGPLAHLLLGPAPWAQAALRGPRRSSAEIGELRGQVQQMHQEMQQLREQLDRFMGQQSGERRPERAPAPPGDAGRR